MSLAVVVDTLAERLAGGLGAGTTVSDTYPGSGAELPAVTLAIEEVTEQMAGIGRIPRGTRTGALDVSIEVNLTNPVLDLGGGDSLLLVPVDRRSLILPHGPLVRADGTSDDPFIATDLQVRDTSVWAVVATTPTGKQVRPDVDSGLLRFGQPLSASGTLRVGYHIGMWDTVVSRYQGRLIVSVAADAGALKALTRKVADVLSQPEGAIRLAPRSWAGASRPTVSELPDHARVQQLTYRFDAEVEQPLVSSGGGVITDVAVTAHADEDGQTRTELFDIGRTPSGGQG